MERNEHLALIHTKQVVSLIVFELGNVVDRVDVRSFASGDDLQKIKKKVNRWSV